MRVLRILVLAVGIVGAVFVSPPAHAAQNGRIIASVFPGLGVARTYWAIGGNCSAAAMAQVNGTDAAFFDVGGYPPGTVLHIDWNGVVGPAGSLSLQFYRSSCVPVQTIASGNLRPGTIRTTVPPGGARWLVIDGAFVANVSLTLR